MKWLNIIAIILSASCFFPVSCTTGVNVGTSVIANLDERSVDKGQEVHSLFKIVIDSEVNDKP